MFITSDVFSSKIVGTHAGCGDVEVITAGVAFHASRHVNARSLVEFFAECFRIVNLTPNEASFELLGNPRNRPVRPSNISALVNRHEGKIGGLNLSSRGPGDILYGGGSFHDDGVYDRPWPCFGYFTFPFSTENERHIDDILRLSVTMLGVNYGYSYLRAAAFNPAGYATGIISANLPIIDEAFNESDDISKWMKYLLNENCGRKLRIRDIFPRNLISREILDRQLNDGITVFDWIDHARCGVLTDISIDVATWSLNDEEMELARKVLWGSGLLICNGVREYRVSREKMGQSHCCPAANSRVGS